MVYKKQAKILFFSLMLLVVMGISFFIFNSNEEEVLAIAFDLTATPPGHNMSGFAWGGDDSMSACVGGPSDGNVCANNAACPVTNDCRPTGLGWISFNSTDCDANTNNFIDVVCGGDDSTTPLNDTWGVTVDRTTHELSGHAWSSTYGWISFNRQTCIGGTNAGNSCDVNGDCPVSNDCSNNVNDAAGDPPAVPFHTGDSTDPDPIAEYDPATKTFSGWARILSLGDDGWIKLKGVATDGSNFGLTWNNNNNKEIHNYAWNAWLANVGMGWISFNCEEGGVGGADICGSIDYRVEANLNSPPIVTSITFDPNDNPMTIGDTYEMRGQFNDPENDDATVYLCTTDSFDYTNQTCDDIAPIPVGVDSWCTGTEVVEGANSICNLVNPIASGLNNYYAFACDKWGACSPGSFSGSFQGNTRPNIDSITTNPAQPNPTITAPDVGFGDSSLGVTVNFTDPEADTYSLYVCSTANFTAGSGCDNDTWCTAGPVAGALLSCSRTANLADAGNHNIYAFICDSNVCSTNQPALTPTFYVNRRPVVGAMSAPNFSPIDAYSNDPASSDDLEAHLRWTFVDADPGDMEDNFRINMINVTDGSIVYNNSDDGVLGNTVCDNTTNPGDCSLDLDGSGGGGVLDKLDWDTSYSFSIQVYDGIAWSQARVFDHSSGDTLTDDKVYNTLTWFQDQGVNANNGNSSNTFTTYAHDFPVAVPVAPLVAVGAGDVEFLPDPPSAGEDVRLTPHSIYYNDDNIGGLQNCDASCSYEWSVADGSIDFAVVHDEQPIVIFNNDGPEGYGLIVLDADGYFSSTGAGGVTAPVNKKLPSWSEVY